MHSNLIEGRNLSEAWARAFLACHSAPGGALAPAVVSFDVRERYSNWALEVQDIRAELERQLENFDIRSVGQSSIETVAGTIFPEPIWRRCSGDRQELYRRYDRIWPRVKKCRANCHGVYFRRLTAFNEDVIKGNQLEKVIGTWQARVHRHSALQAAIFDPMRDHKPLPRKGFPCLQQVAFHPNGPNGRDGLSVTAFYATQYLLEKGYGNYLGLYRLGRFMAGEMGLRLARVVCVASDLRLGDQDHGKGRCRPLADALEGILGNEGA